MEPERFEIIAQDIRVHISQLSDEVSDLTIQIDEKKALLRRLDKALKAIKDEPAKNSKPAVDTSNYGKKNAPAILSYMKEQEGKQEDWTSSQIAAALELSSSSVAASLKYLRARELIRVTRNIQGGGHAYALWYE